MSRSLATFLIFIWVLFSGPAGFAEPIALSDLAPPTLSPEDEKLFGKLTLRQKVGQLFMIGFMGDSIDQGLAETLQTVRPGGIIVFGRNIKTARQISELNTAAQDISMRASSLPLLIGTDQEGGNVIRIKTAMPLPSALALGSADKADVVESAGRATGLLLKTLGFNLNFAPVIDVADPNKAHFIGTRTYGSNPAKVGELGARFSRGMKMTGVMATGKHFPGHGSVEEDSHQIAPVKDVSLAELQAQDILPFEIMKREFSDEWAVMLAHIAYPQVDPTRMPATFSKPIVTGLLRQKLGFNGIVLTDDIEMAGAHVIKDVRERAIRAIEAGADMVMVAWNKKRQRELVESTLKAMQSGRLSKERVDLSVRRIIAAKRLYAKRVPRPSDRQLLQAIRNPEFARIGEATATAIFHREPRPDEVAFREFAQDRPVFLFTTNQRFIATFNAAAPRRRIRAFPIDLNQPVDIDRIMKANPKAVGVFYVSGQQVARVANRIGPDVASRFLVVTVEAPGILRNLSSFRQVTDVYYRHPQLGKLVADFFFSPKVEIRRPAAQPPRTQASVNRARKTPAETEDRR